MENLNTMFSGEGFSKPPPSATRPRLRCLKCLEIMGFPVKDGSRRTRSLRTKPRFVPTHISAQFVREAFSCPDLWRITP
jgi:hypothetical protein